MPGFQQLPLALQLRETATFDNFVASGNEQLVHALTDLDEKYIFIWGEESTGKSHLLQALCHQATQQSQTTAYIPFGHTDISHPDILMGLENMHLVCLDDVHWCAGKDDWELALFNLFNAVREAKTRLIITARAAPNHLNIKLADLVSRLNWGAVFQINLLNDIDKIKVLQERAQQQGLELSSDVASFLLKRHPRDMASLFSLLQQLDQASMAAQRKLTIPFVREFL
ncbi:MAG: DnaA regulatory inactivator Hda [Gammaproteobacteria bacterium]|nr:DnaA regulatory inactivator Hda [Gammaproteobacteria bacterium]MDH5777561.1 DnaA regulatory inactivator Hda [Gammaproteobacteria bacterium]